MRRMLAHAAVTPSASVRNAPDRDLNHPSLTDSRRCHVGFAGPIQSFCTRAVVAIDKLLAATCWHMSEAYGPKVDGRNHAPLRRRGYLGGQHAGVLHVPSQTRLKSGDTCSR